jgi:hypothetical protein
MVGCEKYTGPVVCKHPASSPHTLHALDSHSFVNMLWLCLAIKRASGLSQAYAGNGNKRRFNLFLIDVIDCNNR